jgi:hypothetical protein
LIEPLRTQVLQWLEIESAGVVVTPPPSTDPFTVQPGSNTIDISKAGAGVAGAKLTFDAETIGSILTLSKMQIVAPASTGVHVVFPIFVTMPKQGAGAESSDTSFSNADETIAAGQTAILAPGVLILTSFPADAQMRVEFTRLEPAGAGPDAGSVGGCKSVASFGANAVPAILATGCLNCHDNGGSGNGALDLSGLAKNPKDQVAACAQALNRIDTKNPAQSDIILAPTGGVANHPFKGAPPTFVTMMQAWIAQEK